VADVDCQPVKRAALIIIGAILTSAAVADARITGVLGKRLELRTSSDVSRNKLAADLNYYDYDMPPPMCPTQSWVKVTGVESGQAFKIPLDCALWSSWPSSFGVGYRYRDSSGATCSRIDIGFNRGRQTLALRAVCRGAQVGPYVLDSAQGTIYFQLATESGGDVRQTCGYFRAQDFTNSCDCLRDGGDGVVRVRNCTVGGPCPSASPSGAFVDTPLPSL
jgi:hypothetical protein